MKHLYEHGHRLSHAHMHVTKRPTPARFVQTLMESLPMPELGAQIVQAAAELYHNRNREPGSVNAKGELPDLNLNDDSEENQARLLKEENLYQDDPRPLLERIKATTEASIPTHCRKYWDEIQALLNSLDVFHFEKPRRKNKNGMSPSKMEEPNRSEDTTAEASEAEDAIEEERTLGRHCGFLIYPIDEFAEITGYDLNSLKAAQACLQRVNPPGLGSDDMFHFHQVIAQLFFADQPAEPALYPGPHARLYFSLRDTVERTWGHEAKKIFKALRTLTLQHTLNNCERKGDARKKRSKKQIAKLFGISEEQAVAVLAILDRLPDGPLSTSSLDARLSHKIKRLNREVDFDLVWNDRQCRYVINGVPKWAEDVHKVRSEGLNDELAIARVYLQQVEKDAQKTPSQPQPLTEDQIRKKRFEWLQANPEYKAIFVRMNSEKGLTEADERRMDELLDEMEWQFVVTSEEAALPSRMKRRAKEYLTERELAWWMLDKQLRAYEAKAEHLPRLVEKLVEHQAEYFRTGEPGKRVILSRARLAKELGLGVRKVQHWFLNLVIQVEGKRYIAEDLFVTSESQNWQSFIESIIKSDNLPDLLLEYCTYPWNGVTSHNMWEIITNSSDSRMAERTARKYLKQVQREWLQEGDIFPDKDCLLTSMIARLVELPDMNGIENLDSLSEMVWAALTANFHNRTQVTAQQGTTEMKRTPKAIRLVFVKRYVLNLKASK